MEPLLNMLFIFKVLIVSSSEIKPKRTHLMLIYLFNTIHCPLIHWCLQNPSKPETTCTRFSPILSSRLLFSNQFLETNYLFHPFARVPGPNQAPIYSQHRSSES